MPTDAPHRRRSSGLARVVRPLARVRDGLRVRDRGAGEPPGEDELTPAIPEVPPVSLKDRERVAALQRDMGMEFKDATLLREALTHRSYLNEMDQPWPSNERLEYLGDAVLGVITADYLFRLYPNMNEGELTSLRSALVRTETLARFAEEIQLGQYLFLGRGEEISQGRTRPSGLACAFEALLGGIYVDREYNDARDFALRFVEPELGRVLERRLHKNAKSVLQEVLQGRMQMTPSYHLLEESGPSHEKDFTVEVRIGDQVLGAGRARSKRSAEQAAAEVALATLRDQDCEAKPA
ncbi:MAG: ribonuclease III [Chloroflexota bacterium]